MYLHIYTHTHVTYYRVTLGHARAYQRISIVTMHTQHAEHPIALKRLVVPRHNVALGNAHVKRLGEVCMFWESGIISSIKSGRVPRGCTMCTCSYALFDPWLGTKTPFSLPLPLSLSFSRQSPRTTLLSLHVSPSMSMCHPLLLLSLYVSYSFCLSLYPFLLASIVWDETEQVDNLRIIQKLILLPPSRSLNPLIFF